MEVARGHELQPGTSAGHASVGANAGLGSVPAPPARCAEELMSEDSDDAEESGRENFQERCEAFSTREMEFDRGFDPVTDELE